jgi:hypothetical protein
MGCSWGAVVTFLSAVVRVRAGRSDDMRNRAKATQNVRDGRNRPVRKQAMVEAALRLINEDGKSVKYASTVCGIPQSTLYRWKQDGIDDVSRIRRPGPRTVLTKEEEQKLVGYVLTMSQVGLGLTKDDLIRKVMEILADGRDHPWNERPGQVPGRDWFEGFLRRNPEIVMRSNEKLEKARAKMDTS